MGFGLRLRNKRTRLGLTQEQFGAFAGVKKNAQSHDEIEKRYPNIRYQQAIHAHGIDVLYVISGEQTPNNERLAPQTKT
ncbi:helix-turn-helix domain-containing protein [Agarivorans sp. QJM3NY_25]|uniref:helix-turn-helix domain-containing protein n=1 Tax=Agarivorans sp. QJM3NY_25 TaxID=3421430 RepID=UPI003D7E632D